MEIVEWSWVAPGWTASAWDVLRWSFEDAKCGTEPSRVRRRTTGPRYLYGLNT